jgi:hypothetical protein
MSALPLQARSPARSDGEHFAGQDLGFRWTEEATNAAAIGTTIHAGGSGIHKNECLCSCCRVQHDSTEVKQLRATQARTTEHCKV